MRANQQTNGTVQFRLLSDDQLEEIRRAALHLLEYTGLDVHNAEARALLSGAGAWVDGVRVRLPSLLVEQAQRSAPRSFSVFSREGDSKKDIHISPGRFHYGPGPTCPNFMDPRTGEVRKYTRADARAVATVCDALDSIDFVESLGTVGDIPYELADTYEFAEMVACTGKPIVAWSYAEEGCREIHEIAMAVAGGEEAFLRRPNYVFYCEPLSPLVSNREAMDKVIYCARHRIPLIFTPCVIGGGTGPATMAAIIAQAAAESWLGLVVSQLIRAGTPYCMGGVVSVLDMKEMNLAYGAPELSLLQAGLTELAHHVGLPLWTTGGCSDSKLVDEQSALEGALSVLFAGLCGGDLCHDVGYLESAMTGSLQQLVMMDEVVSYVKRIIRGIEVMPETLAVDAIDRVGPGGSFLADDHTLDHFRSEFWFPTLIDRNRREKWETTGSTRMVGRAQARLIEILDSHKPAPLSAAAQQKIAAVLAGADARFKQSSKS
ncbi:MAG: trimethylamine methyltransferase family protein [Armatimonadota bacterium]